MWLTTNNSTALVATAVSSSNPLAGTIADDLLRLHQYKSDTRAGKDTNDVVASTTTVRAGVGTLLLADKALRGGIGHGDGGEGEADDCDGGEELHDYGCAWLVLIVLIGSVC